MTFSVVQISDLHHDPADHTKQRAFDAVIQQVNQLKPSLVIASGDVSDDGFRNPEMFLKISEQLDRLDAPYFAVPGNHDTGHKSGEPPVKAEYQDQFAAAFGDWKFVIERENWLLVGLNSQVFGSGLAYEQQQWDWFEHQLNHAKNNNQHVAIFTHEVPFIVEPTEQFSDPSDYWSYEPAARKKFLKLIDIPNVKLLATGHLHWHDSRQLGNATWVWCPSASVIVDDARFPSGGAVNGCIEYTFDKDGVSWELKPYTFTEKYVYFAPTRIELPNGKTIKLGQLLLDFTGTLSLDGALLDGVAERLKSLSQKIRITVLTADTFGKAREALDGLPIQFKKIETGADKRAHAEALGVDHCISIGNGKNDVELAKAAAVSIAVVGPEGVNSQLLQAADIVTSNICDALDLVANPLRMKASLRD